METHPSLRNLRIIGLSFVPVIAGAGVAIVALRSGWDDPDDGLATIGLWTTVALVAVGFVAAARWRARVTEAAVPAPQLTTSFFLTLAISEACLLAGFVFTVLARDALPFIVGAAGFAVSLAVILRSIGDIDVEADGTPSGLIR